MRTLAIVSVTFLLGMGAYGYIYGPFADLETVPACSPGPLTKPSALPTLKLACERGTEWNVRMKSWNRAIRPWR